MKNRRRMIDALLLSETMWWRLASLTERFIKITGLELKRLLVGRHGRNLQSAREIYARNLFRLKQVGGSAWSRSGLYIRRVGRLGSARGLVVGQTRKDY